MDTLKMTIKKILVANRSEIAIRVFRAANELGLGTVAVFAAEDKLALHRFKADEAYMIGKGLGPVEAYLQIDEYIRIARKSGADAIHPGYGLLSESPEFVASVEFADMWTSALAFCHKRFEGKQVNYRNEKSGGLGCFTPDSFPVFDVFRQNCYIIADSNHGYKMLGVGELVAREVLGESARLLEPFRISRYALGQLHPVSRSPFPWS